MWRERLRRWLVPSRQAGHLSPGLYHFVRPMDGRYLRYHLRVETSGQALLVAAASEAARLSPAGAVAARGLLEGRSARELAGELSAHGAGDAVRDVQQLLAHLGQPSVRYPIFNLADPALDRPTGLLAPFQADLVVGLGPLSPLIFERLWQAGIFHVRLILDPSSHVTDLVETVERAEDLGIITGLRARAGQLAEEGRVERLAAAGLDYVVLPWGVTVERHDRLYGAGDHPCFQACLERIADREMTVVAQAPLMPDVLPHLESGLDGLLERGVDHVELLAIARRDEDGGHGSPAHGERAVLSAALSAAAAEGDESRPFGARRLRQLAAWIEDLACARRMQLIWLPPVECAAGQSAEAAARGGPRAGGDVTIRVEPDGEVIPPRGPYTSAGNLLVDDWSQIWSHSALDRYRRLVETNTHCHECPGLAICAAECPAEPRGWAWAAASARAS
jgi:radical SAM protein with 4Fe4S-binding SPASM domain